MGTLWKTQSWNILYWETTLNFYIYTSDIWVFHKFKPLKWFRFYKVDWEWELFYQIGLQKLTDCQNNGAKKELGADDSGKLCLLPAWTFLLFPLKHVLENLCMHPIV